MINNKGGARLAKGKSKVDFSYKGRRVAPEDSKLFIDIISNLIRKYNLNNHPNYSKALPYLCALALVILGTVKGYNASSDQKGNIPTSSIALEEPPKEPNSISLEELIDLSSACMIKIEEIEDNTPVLTKVTNIVNKLNLTFPEIIELTTNSHDYSANFNDLLSKYPTLKDPDVLESIISGEPTNIHNKLFIGDSRTLGMLNSGAINNQNTIYGVGYGYKWLIGKGEFNKDKTNAPYGALKVANAKLANSSTTDIILWLGVNDYKSYSADTYFQKYVELATTTWQNHDLYIVSVGPVMDSRAKRVDNAGINDFNKRMESLIASAGIPNIHFINLNYRESSITKYDGAGLHYGAKDYHQIKSIVDEELKKHNSPECDEALNIIYEVLKSYQESLNSISKYENIILGRYRIK